MTTTVIRKIKRPDGVGRWSAYVVSEDTYGLWLYSPKGTIYRGRSGRSSTRLEVGQGDRQAGQHVMHLVPRQAWWIAAWTTEGPSAGIAVDVCTPPELKDGEWHYCDLELDPLAYLDGRVEILDENELQMACAIGLITEAEAAQARHTAQIRSRRLHEEWLLRLSCPVVRIDGSLPIEVSCAQVSAAMAQ
jgi:hypothetical protein